MTERTHRDVFLLSIFTFLVGSVAGVGIFRLYKPTHAQVLEAQHSATVALAATTACAPPSSTTKAAEFRVQQQGDMRVFAHWLWVASRNAADGRDTVVAATHARERFIAFGEQLQQYYSENASAEKIPAIFSQYADAIIAYAIATGVESEGSAVSQSAVEISQDEMVAQLMKMNPGLPHDVLRSLLDEYVSGVEKRDYQRTANALGKYVDVIVAATVRAFPERF